MDILFTLVASVLLIIGFFVICQTSDESEDEQETNDEITKCDTDEQSPEHGTNEQ